MRVRGWRAAGLTVALLAAACGGDAGDDDGGDAGDTGDDAVSSLEDVQGAVIRIEARGTFAEPAGTLTAYQETTDGWSGSGFIIDPEGIAVTNNHVVTGAATLEVFVGDSDESVAARVLGVSECSDLAVIDLEGEGYPFLGWYDGEINPGLEIRAAGFPLGDPEYTLTSGIVSKADADGETSWASVDHVIEHDANIQPGNSGGPLVTEDGRVVAVNYAADDPGTGTLQFFAIAPDLAEPLVEQLQGGDELALGINGVAVVSEEEGLAGVWVSSVDTDSPAGEVGIQAGDVIERLEGLPVGTAGTMEEYCDVLRSHQEGERLAVQVLRFETNEVLEGAFNGDEPLAASSAIFDAAEDAGVAEDVGSGTSYTDYTSVSDDSGVIVMDVPVEWSDVDGSPLELGGTQVPDVAASSDLEAFFQTYNAPGVEFTATDTSVLDVATAMVELAPTDCTSAGREAYDDPAFTGELEFFTACAGTDTVFVLLAASYKPEPERIAIIRGQIVTDADFDAIDRVLATFNFTG